MRAIAGWLPLGILVTLTLGCGDSEPPEGPSVEGPPFLSATIDGLPWSPDPGDLVAFTGDGISLMARRNAKDASKSEMLRIEFATSDLFRLATYRLSGDNSGFAQFTASFTAPGGSPLDSLVWYTTDAQHIGLVTLTGAEVTDSVVSGLFAFEGVDRATGQARHFRGEFRVRYNQFGLFVDDRTFSHNSRTSSGPGD